MSVVNMNKLSSDYWIYFLRFSYKMPSTEWPKHRTCNKINGSEEIHVVLFILSVRMNIEISGYLRAPAAFGPQHPYLRSLGVLQSRNEYRLQEKFSTPAGNQTYRLSRRRFVYLYRLSSFVWWNLIKKTLNSNLRQNIRAYTPCFLVYQRHLAFKYVSFCRPDPYVPKTSCASRETVEIL
jgi:hypothetical protein